MGTKAVNALSSLFTVTSYRDGKYVSITFAQGQMKSRNAGKTDEPNGTFVSFIPDPQLFGKYAFNDDFIIRRLQGYAYLNSGLTLEYNGATYRSKDGLLDLLREEVGDSNLYDIIHFRSDKLEFAFTHVPGDFGKRIFPM